LNEGKRGKVKRKSQKNESSKGSGRGDTLREDRKTHPKISMCSFKTTMNIKEKKEVEKRRNGE